MNIWNRFRERFLKRKRSGWVPSSTMGSSVSTTYVHQKLIWHVSIHYFSKINQFKMVQSWSWCSWTPSATLTSSTKASTASSSYVHQNDMAHINILFLTNWIKTVPAWYRVIKMLSDTLSHLAKLNHGEFRKCHLCPSKIDMAHVYILLFKDKSIQDGPKVIIVLSETLSDLDKLNYGEYKYQLWPLKKGKNENFIWVFSRFRWFFTTLKKFEKDFMKLFSAPNCLKRLINTKKNICCLFPLM